MTYTRLQYNRRYEDINVLFEVFSLLPMAVLSISFGPLIWKLRQHHYLVYKKEGLQIIYFFAFEVANCAMTQIIQGLLWTPKGGDGKEQIYLTYIAIYIYSGYNTILQSIGVIYVKNTKDPLESISKLGLLQLVSINQRTNDNFMEGMYVDVHWNDLSTSQ